MKKRPGCILLCFALLFSLLNTVGCAPFFEQTKQETTYLDLFDTVSTVTVYGVDADTFAAQQEQLHDFLLEYHQLADIYHDYPGIHNLKTVNDAAGGDPVPVDERLIDLLEYGKDAYALTHGRVNILLGAVLQQWHDCREAANDDPAAATLPAASALAEGNKHTNPALLVIDRTHGTVCLTDRSARIDMGAIAKGYATEQAARFAAKTLGWTSAMLNIGGNIRTVGGKGDAAFNVGIQNPDLFSAQAYLLTVPSANNAVVTSGDYQRFFTVDGKQYHHIIDPDTLFPAEYLHAVTVICPDSGTADLLSTALFTLPVEQGLELLNEFPSAEAVFVLPDGTLRYSDGFPQ